MYRNKYIKRQHKQILIWPIKTKLVNKLNIPEPSSLKIYKKREN